MFSKPQYKIVFTGPVGAGKTTAIRVLSDIDPVSTEQLATDQVVSRKGQTTVALDYGSMKIAGQEVIHLYGTPGQKRFDFMWEILTSGGIGLIILLDNSSHDPVSDMRFYIDSFRDFLTDHKLSIGINFINEHCCSAPTIDDYYNELHKLGFNPPVFEVDCRQYQDVSLLVQSLIYSCDPWLGQ